MNLNIVERSSGEQWTDTDLDRVWQLYSQKSVFSSRILQEPTETYVPIIKAAEAIAENRRRS